MNTKEAIKVAFEQVREGINGLGIDTGLLMPIMSELVADYAAAGNFSLSVAAAKVTGKPDDFRVILGAMEKSCQNTGTNLVGVAGLMEIVGHEHDLIEVLKGIGDEAILREFAAQHGSYRAMKILAFLKDADGFMALGRQQEAAYFLAKEEEKQTNVSRGNTSSMPHDVVKAYSAALDLGHAEASSALIEFADRLKALNGIGGYYGGGLGSDNKSPLQIAYEKAGTADGWARAGQLYLEWNESADDKARSLKLLKTAAEAFVKAGDFETARQIATQLAQGGDVASAIKLIGSTGIVLDAEVLGNIMNASVVAASVVVREAVIAYLKKHECEIPFPTSHTFWHFSDSNLDEWSNYLLGVEELSGRFDLYRGFGSEKFVALAKSLYSSDKVGAIKQIHRALQRHLLVGYMLSAVAFEIKHGKGRDRKYDHPTYAAWRTFENAVTCGGYNPFRGDIGLKEDAVVSNLFDYLNSIMEERNGLMEERGGWMHDTWQSNRFIFGKLPEMHDRCVADYNRIAQEIQEKLALL